ncbi:MAG: hypothetical protein NC339_05965 [Muribaculaceae bacterium]|nr:hypothetical protein [Muribaculaceae bacterium]
MRRYNSEHHTLGAVLLALIAGMALSACSSWWIGSGGWGVSETLPGGLNVGINGPFPGQGTPPPPPPPRVPYPY